MSVMHKLLARQIARTTLADGGLDIDALLGLVSSAYDQSDLDRRRSDRATTLMAEEVESAHEALQSAAADLALQNIRFSAALNNMSQGLCLFDQAERLVVCNRRFLDIYELPPEAAAPGRTLAELIAPSPVFAAMTAAERRRRIDEHANMAMMSPAGLDQEWPDGRAIAIARNPVADGGFVDTIADVTESRNAIAKIAHMALHDALTDLPNRVLFRQKVGEALEHARRGEICAVLCLDLDRFKPVNDTLGHAAGDAVLRQVATRLTAGLEAADTAARLGGDEFALVLRRLRGPGEAIERSVQLIEALRKPYKIGAHVVSIGASVGVDILDPDYRDCDRPVANADMALYKSKMAGRGRCSVFSSPMIFAKDARAAANEMDVVHSGP